MASITSTGIGSGLDVQGIVEKLVAAEGSPVTARLDRQEAKAQAGLSAMGTFKSALAEFQSSLKSLREAQNFQTMAAGSDNEEVLTVTASDKAQPGEYEIEVNQLAEAQRLTSVLFDSDQDPISGGTIQIQFGRYNEDTNKFTPNADKIPQTIKITEDRSSLRDIQRSINEAEVGIRASIIKDDIGYRLVLSSSVTGEKNSLRITVEDNDAENSDLAGLSLISFNPEADDGDGRNMVEMQAAIDAEIEIDGLTIHNASNTITESLDGLTLKLNDTGDADVNVYINKTEVVDRIKYFVEQYNKFVGLVESLTAYDPETRQAGPLNGDSTVRGVSNQLRRIIGTPFSGINKEFVTLASIGLRTEFDGTISLNETKLTNSLE
ncbi:MAG: flagellar filament capping protein FliD, partial [Gammaproteobacteria bacterium]|nr:flagellar filament capping protein FliD [Gammaproteobacteria bacterium]